MGLIVAATDGAPIHQFAIGIPLIIFLQDHVLAIGHLFAVCIQRSADPAGLVPVVCFGGIGIELIIFHQRIQHLLAGLFLPVQNGLQGRLLNIHILEAHFQIVIHANIILVDGFLLLVQRLGHIPDLDHRLAVLLHTFRCRSTATIAIGCANADGGQADQLCLGDITITATVNNADSIPQPGNTGRHTGIEITHKIDLIRRDQGHDEGIQHDHNNDEKCHHRCLTFPETNQRIPKIANGLIFKLLIANTLIFLHKGKLFLWDIHIYFLFSHIISLPF